MFNRVFIVVLIAACRPPAFDALDAGAQLDAGIDAGTQVALDEDFASVFLSLNAPTGSNGERLIPIGLPVTFTAYGRFIDGSSQPLHATASWRVTPDDGTVTLRRHDGMLELTATRAATLQLTVELQTPEGFTLSNSTLLKASPALDVRLRAFTAQDGPWYEPQTPFTSPAVQNAFNAFDSSGGPPPPATAPITGAVRIITAALLTLDGKPARYHLDPTQLTYAASEGLTVSSAGLVHVTSPQEGLITVSLPGATSTTATAVFVNESPTSALGLTGDGPLLTATAPESTAPEGTVTLDSILEAPASLAAIGFAGTRAGRTTRVWLLARHGHYVEWLPLSATSHVVLERPDAYLATDDGRLHATTPGVGLHVFSARGFSLPVLIRTPYPVGTTLSLRAEPPAVTLAPKACTDLTLRFKAERETEHVLTPLEQLVVAIDPPVAALPLLDAARTRPLHWCAATTMVSSRTTTITLGYLGATTSASLTVPK